jgi:hypothetical protein
MRTAMAIAAMLSMASVGCGDPVRENSIDALGGERPGVPKGPLHRPGEPCVLCHGGNGPGESTFAFAGTVYQTEGAPTPLADAIVRLIDSTGKKYETGTNCAGNFFVLEDDYAPTFPVWAKVIFGTSGGKPVPHTMGSPIYREKSCAKCHTERAGPESVGPVYFAPKGVPFPARSCP